jgi:hypothetical protein
VGPQEQAEEAEETEEEKEMKTDAEEEEEEEEEDESEAERLLRKTIIKREASLEFLPLRYHHVFTLLPSPVLGSKEYTKLTKYFLVPIEMIRVVSGGGSRSGQRRTQRTGVWKCLLGRYGKYATLHETCLQLQREEKHAPLLVLLRLAQLSLIDPSAKGAGHVLPWERPRLVSSDLSGEPTDLTAEKEEEEVPVGPGEFVEDLAVDVEAFCAEMRAVDWPDASSSSSSSAKKE